MNIRLIISTLSLIILYLSIFPKISLADYPDGYYQVRRVIDGRTFELTDGKRVRLIGIDTPEAGEVCSVESTQELSSFIEGETVYLEKDVSEADIYGRLLRYVYVNSLFVNYQLVYSGYAYAIEYPPDTKYSSLLSDAEDNAQSHERGCLWYTGCISCDGDSSWFVASCFIATAAYGSPRQPYVKILRDFRDRFLLTNSFGKAFVQFYYKYSPPMADFIAGHTYLRAIVRVSLLPVVGASWIALQHGPEATMVFMLFFAFSLTGFFKLRRKFNR